MNIQRILVPTDLSDFSAAALRWAGVLQPRLGAQVTVLYANEPYVPFDVMEGPAAYMLQSQPELRDRLNADFHEYVPKHLPGADVSLMMVDDAPAAAILKTAKAIHADLIVMTTHGRSGWRRALLGSIAEKVVHHADRPVLVIPPSDAPPSVGRILCPVNFTNIARQSLEQAAAYAQLFDAELLVVHVADALDPATDFDKGFAAWVDPDIRGRCRYSHMVATGNAAEETLRMAKDTGTDLIVLGAQHRWFADATVIGTTTERVIRFARCPVLTVFAPATSRRQMVA